MESEHIVRTAAVHWDIRRGEVQSNLDTAVELLESAASDDTKLAVLPEMWGSSFMGDDADSVTEEVARAEKTIQTLSGDHQMVVTGTNYEFSKHGKLFNRATLYDNGKLIGEYRKIHLFSPMGEDRYFDHGSEALIVETSVGRVGVAICYDLRFPELTRYLFLSEAQILLLPSQWPEPRAAHWRLLARSRAIENQWFFVGANRSGIEASLVNGQQIHFPGNSIIVDPTGEVLAEGDGEAGVIIGDLDLKQTAVVRRAIPVSKDRHEDVYTNLWSRRWTGHPIGGMK
ncbi:MAG: nitrilase-related carbon-nitrogen hydrolase [Planctomycetota bacterium]